jgi:putative phage-type endonuclease
LCGYHDFEGRRIVRQQANPTQIGEKMPFNILRVTDNMTEEDWLKSRTAGIGGSEIAKIAGVSPWGNAITVYLDKISQDHKEKDAGEAAYWGNRLEDIVASEFEKRTGMFMTTLNAIIQSTEYPWMIGNVDRVIYDKTIGDGILECKTTGVYTPAAKVYLDEDNRIYDEHMCQVQWYMGITGYQYAFVAVLIGGQRFVIRKAERDEEIISHLVKIGGDFWEMVKSRTAPAIDGSDASSKLLDTLYAKSNKQAVDILSPEAMSAAEQLKEAREAVKVAEAMKQEAENKIKSMMREYEVATCGGYQFTWKEITANRLDGKGLEKAHPDLYKMFLKSSTYRRFEIKEFKTKSGGLV